MLANLVSFVVSTLVGALALKLAVWMVASSAPNSLLRALLVNLCMGVVWLGVALVGVGLTAATGGLGAVVAIALIILAPLLVLRAAYGIGTLRAIVLVIALALCHALLGRLVGLVVH